MTGRLSGKFEFRRLCGFVCPSVFMFVFMSMYTMVDGVFVSRLIGTDALSAVNICSPFILGYWAVGIMLASGSVAIIAKRLGEGRIETARKTFTFMLLAATFAGAAIGLAGHFALDPLLRLLGATPELFGLCRDYASFLMPFVPAAILQAMFHSYFVAAGRPGFGFAAVSLGGAANIVLDYAFMAIMDYGVAGAALATGISCCVPAISGLLYFSFNRTGSLRLATPKPDWETLFSSLVNGSSEMVTNISAAIVVYLYNIAMLRHAGVDGVAAITIVLYAEFLLNSAYFGFAGGVSPLFSYAYGKNNMPRLRQLFRNSLLFIGASAAMSIPAAWLLAGTIVALFAPDGSEVFAQAIQGMKLFAIGFAFLGFNVFFFALFTALSNGKISAMLALSRFLFIVACIFMLPRIMGNAGIWLAGPAAEFAALALGAFCANRFKSTYRYA
ncbi:MAG: MATE family efflux transporter [Planctomycetota bacterium]|nr:MATE family efflux transporter [Planctomycetota bacterium]